MLWEKAEGTNIQSDSLPSNYQTYKLDETIYSEEISTAGNNENHSILIELPDPQGISKKFSVWKSNAVSQALLEKFPHLQAYRGVSAQDKKVRIRLELNPSGMHVMVIENDNTWYIEPLKGNEGIYLIYYKKDLPDGVKSFWSDKVLNDN